MEKVKFGEVAYFKTGKLNSNAAVENGKYPFFTCSPETLRIDEYAFDQAAILLAGNNAEGNFNVKYYEGKFNAYQRTYVITCDPAKADLKYIYYALKVCLQRFKYISQGTATKFLTAQILNAFEISIPELHVQKRIASVLHSLDNKIELNNSVNQNLLHQVTAFFHDHFDEYEFSTEDTMLLGDVARFKYGTMPKKDKLGSGEYVAFSGYQVVGSYPERMFSDPQLIVVARGVGGCGDIKYTPADCYLTNLSIAILTSSIAMEDYLFNYLRLHDTKVMNTGSAQPQITVSTLEKYQLPIPPLDRLQSFSALVQPYKSMYRKNKDENERLQMLRDTLLPRLMSGELNVSEIEV